MPAIAVQEGQSPFGTQAVTVAAYQGTLPVAGKGINPPEVNWKDLHTRLVSMFESSEDSSRKAREYAERDVDYFDNKQWTEKEAKTIRDRGQPVIMKNRLRQKVKYLQGLEQQKRTEPRALPRTPQHDFDANDCTDALRFVVQSNRYDQIRSKVWWDLVVAGWGGYSVTVEFRPPMANPRVVIKRTRWDRMFWDPFSSEVDFSDAKYLGEVLWMDREDAVRQYGDDAGKVFDETVSTWETGGTFDDKPKQSTWVAYDKRYRVRVVKMYYVGDDGAWNFCEFTKGGYLKSGISPWLDENKKPEHEYVWRSAYVDRDNNRYGDIRDLIDTQDEINKRSSKLLHLASVRQTFGNRGMMGNLSPEELRKELARADGHLDTTGGEFGKDFGVIPTSDLAKAQGDLLQLNLAEMEQQGANAAMLGNASRDASGRAVLANQAGGELALSPMLDTAKDADNEVYRKVWHRIRQFWNAEEWVRVTDDDNAIRWVGLNAPVMLNPETGQPYNEMVPPGQPAMPAIDPATGQPTVRNRLADLDIDIIISDAPPIGTMQQEEFAKLAELGNSPLGQLKSYPKLLIQASSFRSKAEMLKELSEREKQAPEPDPETMKAQAQMQLKQAEMQANMQLEQQRMAMQREEKSAELAMKQQEQAAQLQFEAQKHAQEMQFMREKFELEQVARAQAARDAHANAQRQESRAH